MVTNITKSKEYTKEQEKAVRRVLGSKDHYETLGLSYNANESDIKKKYRNLAKEIHPDKNSAPNSKKAMQKVLEAYSVLSDPVKKIDYNNLRGFARESKRSERESNRFEREFNRFEREFNRFKRESNRFKTGSRRFNRESTWSETDDNSSRHHQNYQKQQSEPESPNIKVTPTQVLMFASFFAILSISIVIAMARSQKDAWKVQKEEDKQSYKQFNERTFYSFDLTDPLYEFEKSDKYPDERRTSYLKVPYYLKKDLGKDEVRKIQEVEIEEAYMEELRSSCVSEKSHRDASIWEARKQNLDEDLISRAAAKMTPSCDKLNDIYNFINSKA